MGLNGNLDKIYTIFNVTNVEADTIAFMIVRKLYFLELKDLRK